MNLPPLVSIVVPVYNDEPTIEAAIRSAITQTLDAVEILVVDDDSTDGTPEVVERLSAEDSRVRLLRQPENMSAFQARRRGILEAQAPYVMFLDGDDELERHAAAKAVTLAQASDADMVQFGVSLYRANVVQTGGGFESRLQPRHAELVGEAIAINLFPAGLPVGGQLWKYLFRTALLREAYSALPSDLRVHRANDLPIAYLAAVFAGRYVSTPEKLYQYHFQRGGSGNRIQTLEQVHFQMLPIDSIEVISDAVDEAAYRHSDPQTLLESYASARLAIIGAVLPYIVRIEDDDLARTAVELLEERATRLDVVRAAAQFQPQFLNEIARHIVPDDLKELRPRSVLLTTSQLTTGGVSGVLLTQARLLLSAGYRVGIVAQREGSDPALVPQGATFYEVTGATLAEKLDSWADICRAQTAEVVIEHRVLYSRHWPSFALMARACGAATIGWIHNFAGRPIYDLTDLHTFMARSVPILSQLVVLSPLDVAFWKLRGQQHTAYLPNPPSPLLLEHGVAAAPKSVPQGPFELVWVGRLDERTKQVRALFQVAEELRALGADFHLSVIGPEWPGMTVQKFNAEAAKRGLADAVVALGPRAGQELVDSLDRAHAFVGTSVIEGYPLTLLEAQSRGLPVFIFDMPWLPPARDTHGVLSVPQGDARRLAELIVQTMNSPSSYTALSEASLRGAQEAVDFDFGTLYEQLVSGTLDDELSPDPTLEDARRLLDLTVFFAERNAGILQRHQSAQKAIETVRSQLKQSEAQIRQHQAQAAKLQKEVTRLRRQARSLPVAQSPAAASHLSTRETAAATPPGRTRPRWRRALGRLKRGLVRSFTPKPQRVTRAEIVGEQLQLTIKMDRRGLPSTIQAVREVDGRVETHDFTVAERSSRVALATVSFVQLRDRRWSLTATHVTPHGELRDTLPIERGAPCLSDGVFRVRTFDAKTIQVVQR